jgi:D-tyrosyl-tRNA(Tyr) deacylase
MRAVIQRVSAASVNIEEHLTAQIKEGFLIFLGIEDGDSFEDAEWLSGKISRLRIFRDEGGMMNLSVKDTGGEVLVISQFTLHASTKKGNRPSYIRAAKPETAIPLYNQFIGQLSKDLGIIIQTGEFGAYMKVSLINDGPVTIIIDTKNRE